MNELEKEFGNNKQWCNWRFETVKGKLTKVPYFSKTRKASSTDPKTWITMEEAEIAFNNGGNKFDGMGLFFPSDETLLGIDFDMCLENGKIKHEKKDEIERFIKESNTYTEISPSGTGLHVFLNLEESLSITNKKEPKSVIKTDRKAMEIYTKERYFTVTNNPYGKTLPVRKISKKEALRLLMIIGYPWTKEEATNKTVSKTSESFDDATIIKKMFASKNGKDAKALYEGSSEKYKGDESSADMALCMHLAFWTGRNPIQIERIWLESPLGKREKTQTRKDYRDRTVNASILNTTEVYESSDMRMKRENPDLELLFKTNKEGDKIFIQNTENMCRILKGHPDFKDKLRYDVFKNTLEILKNDRWRNMEDNDAVNTQTSISILFPCFSMVGKTMVYEAMIKVAKENTIDSASDFIRSITWDKTYRLDSWLTSVYGTPDDKVHKAIGSNWIKGLVKRIIEPGCKFDYVLVLEGEQGVKKSTSLAVLGGNWHVETTMSTDTKDFFMQFQGKAIIEFSEGETLSRTEVKRMKAIITMQSDKYRPPYERNSQDFPRRCVFAMTTNQTEYLKDETGNRRWLPVAVSLPQANIEWLEQNRNQLFAEAYHRVFNLNETIYEFPNEIFEMQKARQIRDANEELVRHWYFVKLTSAQRKEGITVYQVYRDALHSYAPSKPMSKYDEMSIAGILKIGLGLKNERVVRDAIRSMRWFNPNKEIEQTEDEIIQDAVYKF